MRRNLEKLSFIRFVKVEINETGSNHFSFITILYFPLNLS